MSTKPKKNPPLRNKEELYSAADRYAELDTKKQLLEAKRNRLIQDIQDEHNPKIKEIEDEMKALKSQAKTYSTAFRDDLFIDKEKTLTTPLARISFRTSPGALKPINDAWTEEVILVKVKAEFGDHYIRVKEEINKEQIQADFGDDAAKLATVGLKNHKPESFEITPKVKVSESVSAA